MLETLCHRIDNINEWIGRTTSWLFLPFAILVVIDVVTRYALRHPWFYIDINVQIMGTLILLAGGYLLVNEGHIGVDVLVTHLSPRHRAILDIVLFPIFIGSIGALLWRTGIAAGDSWRILECGISGLDIPIYPLKTIVAIGFFLVLLQGTSKFIRNIMVIKS